MLTAIGLILDCLGVLIITVHILYDIGIDAVVRITEESSPEKDRKIISDFISGKKVSPSEKERFVCIIKEQFTINTAVYVVSFWLWINRHVFHFAPWIEEKPRVVNRYLWNLLGLLLILAGFLFQLARAFLR